MPISSSLDMCSFVCDSCGNTITAKIETDYSDSNIINTTISFTTGPKSQCSECQKFADDFGKMFKTIQDGIIGIFKKRDGIWDHTEQLKR